MRLSKEGGFFWFCVYGVLLFLALYRFEMPAWGFDQGKIVTVAGVTITAGGTSTFAIDLAALFPQEEMRGVGAIELAGVTCGANNASGVSTLYLSGATVEVFSWESISQPSGVTSSGTWVSALAQYRDRWKWVHDMSVQSGATKEAHSFRFGAKRWLMFDVVAGATKVYTGPVKVAFGEAAQLQPPIPITIGYGTFTPTMLGTSTFALDDSGASLPDGTHCIVGQANGSTVYYSTRTKAGTMNSPIIISGNGEVFNGTRADLLRWKFGAGATGNVVFNAQYWNMPRWEE